VSFWELPWLIVTLFVRGDFGRNDGPNETPMAARSIMGVLALLALLILAGFLIVEAIWRTDALQACALHGFEICTSEVK
jgi:hypothetical protein